MLLLVDHQFDVHSTKLNTIMFAKISKINLYKQRLNSKVFYRILRFGLTKEVYIDSAQNNMKSSKKSKGSMLKWNVVVNYQHNIGSNKNTTRQYFAIYMTCFTFEIFITFKTWLLILFKKNQLENYLFESNKDLVKVF